MLPYFCPFMHQECCWCYRYYGKHNLRQKNSREFTLEELTNYDGGGGKSAYVAVNGVVYDVSNEAAWGGGTHFGLIAGKDVSEKFKDCHEENEILSKLPKVGILKP